MRVYNRTLILAIAGLTIGAPTIGAALGACSPNFPTGTIEKKYNATGPWTVTVAAGAGCCDSKGDHYDLTIRQTSERTASGIPSSPGGTEQTRFRPIIPISSSTWRPGDL